MKLPFLVLVEGRKKEGRKAKGLDVGALDSAVQRAGLKEGEGRCPYTKTGDI